MEYTYIKKSVNGRYRVYNEPFDPELNNNLGNTYEDYLDDKWVLLSAEQVAFHEENPNASVEEVWNMELNPNAQEDPVEVAKREKIWDIMDYDNSDNVNSFTVGSTLMWLDFDERARIRVSIEAYEAAGMQNMSKWFNGVEYTFTIALWKQMLNALEIYAAEALNVTESHKATIISLNTVEAIEAYDITLGYPAKLIF